MWTSPGGCAPEDTGCNTCPQRASPIIPMRMAGPKLGRYAGSFYGNLLLRYKFGSWRDIWRGHKMYLGALRRPLHFNGVRRVLAKNYLRHFIKLWPFLFWRFSHRAEYGARPARFEGGFSPDRGLWKFTPPQETPLISVIVRTCGRPQTLKRTLESLRWQTYRNFEIIVAEDGPPAAREMVERDFAELPIRYLTMAVPRPCSQRQPGACGGAGSAVQLSGR